jgi:hypothetical protein
MAGTQMMLFNKRMMNFDQLTASQTETYVVVKSLDVTPYREGMITVRAHTRDIVHASSKIEVIAYVTSPSPEEPQTDFVLGTAVATATVAPGSTATFVKADLANMGGYLRIIVLGTRGASGNCKAEISADIVLKE